MKKPKTAQNDTARGWVATIVDRLRAMSGDMIGPYVQLTKEAADEIERLRKQQASDWIQGKNETIKENSEAVIRRQCAKIEQLRIIIVNLIHNGDWIAREAASAALEQK